MNIVLGVGGGIAAYKACHVLRALREAGHAVRVVPTANALAFVGTATWEALSGQPVATDVFTRVDEVEHVMIGQRADLVLIAPATADLLARLRAGRADDLLTATVLATRAPVALAPAMHTEMWANAATADNVAVLRARGLHVMEPVSGRLTGADSGPGRLPEPEDIVAFALAAAAAPAGAPEARGASGAAGFGSGAADEERPAAAPARLPDLRGQRYLISAGGTREPLDPVRFLGNRSSGKQGAQLARAAAQAGAAVDLVAANIDVAVLADLPPGVRVRAVETTAQLQTACAELAPGADAVIMAAAVADYRPAHTAEHKMKKDGDAGLTLELAQNPDVLRGLVAQRAAEGWGAALVGFAAETGSPGRPALELAEEKLLRKGCDLLVFNDVSAGRAFGSEDNEVAILAVRDGRAHVAARAHGSKAQVSHAVIGAVAALPRR
ncbi:bifunctional phosphopantothenoylcysteine decarboxylase/phosphopantothenate synthase [Brevibacterium sp. BRM-1]|uniref:bifunctional phosphopantothenoylcysteine decarboxylase/phosphopantothenate synthase n=1 Tax=Brevibacterium sp. BRM-1 TaxID=2999062 RepID=UPI00228210F9|nr:bifunctional phosphopantothenoylcysteine decarboxylase/phosphopantothenate synthase [Brevibacterium sp. BRM-1]WAL40896.1 bifunctional phosphopantothenoylcysteine decarboxylase/phosphopantothenate synthase [Brevibacterium sp. BRM-1]